jgi:hypothetical protein
VIQQRGGVQLKEVSAPRVTFTSAMPMKSLRAWSPASRAKIYWTVMRGPRPRTPQAACNTSARRALAKNHRARPARRTSPTSQG